MSVSTTKGSDSGRFPEEAAFGWRLEKLKMESEEERSRQMRCRVPKPCSLQLHSVKGFGGGSEEPFQKALTIQNYLQDIHT